MIEVMNYLGFLGIIFSIAIYIPILIGVSLLLWTWAIKRVRVAYGVEQAVLEYNRNKSAYLRWKKQQTALVKRKKE